MQQGQSFLLYDLEVDSNSLVADLSLIYQEFLNFLNIRRKNPAGRAREDGSYHIVGGAPAG